MLRRFAFRAAAALLTFLVAPGWFTSGSDAMRSGMFVTAARAQQQGQFLNQRTVLIREVVVEGNRRVEPETVLAYMFVGEGDIYNEVEVDRSLKELFATGLFGDVTITLNGDVMTVAVVENPIINQIVFEGNSSTDDETLGEESQLQPRDVYTRAKVRSEVRRIIEIYRRSGRFSAHVDPKVILLDENRVDLVYEIDEGPKTGVRRIIFIGNHEYSDRDLKSAIQTKQSVWWNFLTSEDNYDPDRLAFDKQLLRQFYNNNGYADFKVISAIAELTPDQVDFYLTFTVSEGARYRFDKVIVESEIEEIDAENFVNTLFTRPGDTFSGQDIEVSIERLEFALGSQGFAFAQVRPDLAPREEEGLVDITYHILQAPRVYVERINISGNVRTLDKVIRRELRLAEGDAFNAAKMERSKNRIRGLGYFSEVEVINYAGSQPDRTVIDVEVEEQATGELSFGVGFSSTDNFLFDLNVTERNFLGKGQRLRVGAQLSGRVSSFVLGFTEPYFMNKPLSMGVDLFRTASNFSSFGGFDTTQTGMRLSTGFPIVEHLSLFASYTIQGENISVDPILFPGADPDEIPGLGTQLSSGIGLGLTYSNVDNPIRPRSGLFTSASVGYVGVGGDIKIASVNGRLRYFYPVAESWTLQLKSDFGLVEGLGQPVDANNRVFIGGQTFRGFDVAGVGPRLFDDSIGFDRAVGGNKYWTAALELAFPIPLAEEFGMRGSIFIEAGALSDVDVKGLFHSTGLPLDQQVPDFQQPFSEAVLPFLKDTGKPRLTVGIGVEWDSPFGPLTFNLAHALISEPFDDTKLFFFNVGTGF